MKIYILLNLVVQQIHFKNVFYYFFSEMAKKSYKKVTYNSWKIFTTDIFDNKGNTQETNCNNLQILYDPFNSGSGQSVGDLDIRLGKIPISSTNSSNTNKQVFVDDVLLLTSNDYSTSSRKLYIGKDYSS